MGESVTNRQIESLRRHVTELERQAGRDWGQVQSILPPEMPGIAQHLGPAAVCGSRGSRKRAALPLHRRDARRWHHRLRCAWRHGVVQSGRGDDLRLPSRRGHRPEREDADSGVLPRRLRPVHGGSPRHRWAHDDRSTRSFWGGAGIVRRFRWSWRSARSCSMAAARSPPLPATSASASE